MSPAAKVLDKMQLPDDIRQHPDVVLAVEQSEQSKWAIAALQCFYMLGVGATGYATYDLFVSAGFPALGAIAIAVVMDAFGMFMAYLSTRARLRNQTDLSTRASVYLGAVASGVMNYLFHDTPLLKIGLPIAVVLSMVCWVKSVADKYAAIFLVQKMVARRERSQKRQARREWFAFVVAVRPWRAIGKWGQRTAELGVTKREVVHTVAMAGLAAQQEIGTTQAAAAIEAASVEPERRGPFPPNMRPVSGAPLDVQGDDELASFLEGCTDKSDAVRELMKAWWVNYQQHRTALFDIPFETINSAVALIRLLNRYNIWPGESTVKNLKRNLIAAGKFPGSGQIADIRVAVDAEVVNEPAITAR